jgi:uncharacterized membrane protein
MRTGIVSAAWAGWAVIATLAVLIGVISLRFLSLSPEAVSEELRSNLLDHPFFFFMLTIVAPIPLIVGVWQFLPATRRSAYHRWAGRLYVTTVAIASVSGLIIAPTTAIGPAAGIGFAILAVLWFAATAIAFYHIRSRNIARHRIWMIRSYALTCAAITLRIILPTGIALGAGFANSYIVAAWGCWIINLIVAEAIIRRPGRRLNNPTAA